MDVFEAFGEAWSSLAANKLRSALTMLGVIIGVGAVIALVSLGGGVELFIKAEFSDIGTNLIAVQPGKVETRGLGPPPGGGVRKLTLEDVDALRLRGRSIRAATALTIGAALVEHGSFARNVNIVGTDAEWVDVFNIQAEVGRFFSEADVDSQRRVAVIGRKVKSELFGTRNAVGEAITVGGSRFRIIGVAASKGNAIGFDFDDLVYVPVGLAQRLFGIDGLFGVRVRAESETALASAAEQVRQILVERHGEEDFTLVTQNEMFETLGNILRMLTIFLSGVAGISLVVGGIGIMNIMLVTVRERTREIGLRKAVGARRKDILVQFLIEAMVLSTIGGSIGILLGAGGPQLLHLFVPSFPAVTTLGSVLVAFGFSLAVGVVFGVFPAVQASRLDPIVALRWD
jgi:putative ABC transport system permease protein